MKMQKKKKNTKRNKRKTWGIESQIDKFKTLQEAKICSKGSCTFWQKQNKEK